MKKLIQTLKSKRKLFWFALSSMALYSFSSLAFPVEFSGIIPGMPTTDLTVKSVHDIRYKNMVAQSFDFSCGAAAMATLLKYGFNKDVSENDILRGLMVHGDKDKIKKMGFSLLDLKSYAQSQGFYSEGYKLSIQQLQLLKVPVIILLDVHGYRHFVVLKKIQGNQVFFADPALGNRALNIADFSKSWNNIVLVVMNNHFNPQSELLNPEQPLSVHKMFYRFNNPMQTQQLDYGIRPTGLF